MAQGVGLLTRDTAQGVGLLDIAATPVAPVITTTALPNGRVGQAYSQTVQATGTPSPTAAITAGALPAGLALTGSTRRISGTPTTPVASAFDVTVTNSAGSDVESLSILVPNEGTGGDAPAVTTVTLVPAAVSLAPAEDVDLLLTVEDQSGNPIANVAGTVDVADTAFATATQLAPTDASGQATVRVTGVSGGQTTVVVTVDGVASNSVALDVRAGNLAPTDIAISAASVVENAANGTVIGALSATDADQASGHTFTLTNDAGGRFGISGSNLVVANGSLLNHEAASSHSITVRATDADGLTFDKAFTIAVTNANEAPTAIALSATAVLEGAPNGSVVGLLSRTDPDAGDTGTYSLDDSAGGRFGVQTVGPASANLVVVDGSLIDYETAQSHSVTVRFTDAGGLFVTQAFVISVQSTEAGVTTVSAAGTEQSTPSGTASVQSYVAATFSEVEAVRIAERQEIVLLTDDPPTPYAFDFRASIADGETIVSQTIQVTCPGFEDLDPTPELFALGGPSVSGELVTQYFQPMIANVRYLARCVVTTSLGQRLVRNVRIRVLEVWRTPRRVV